MTATMSLSISKLTKWLAEIAQQVGVEVMTGFAVEDILVEPTGRATGVKLVDQGRDKEGHPQPNFLPGETINADIIILAEGCDGLVTEKFIKKAGLRRKSQSALFGRRKRDNQNQARAISEVRR